MSTLTLKLNIYFYDVWMQFDGTSEREMHVCAWYSVTQVALIIIIIAVMHLSVSHPYIKFFFQLASARRWTLAATILAQSKMAPLRLREMYCIFWELIAYKLHIVSSILLDRHITD